MKRTPLRRVSKKQSAKLKIYTSLRKKFLMEHPICGVCFLAEATQVHHKEQRAKNLNNVPTWLAICDNCHRAVHEHPKWARDNGFLK